MLCTRCLALRLCGHVAFYTPVAQPQKAYKNSSFLGSSDAQSIRILCELLETKQRLASAKVHHTILVRWPVALWRVDHRHPTRIFFTQFFGSARSRTPKQHASEVENAKDILAANPEDPAASAKLAQLEKCAWLSDFYNKTAELSERLTEWSMSRPLPDGVQRYTVCTGGGPGMMKAANLGASRVPGALSMGMGISLPFETSMNAYVTRGLVSNIRCIA